MRGSTQSHTRLRALLKARREREKKEKHSKRFEIPLELRLVIHRSKWIYFVLYFHSWVKTTPSSVIRMIFTRIDINAELMKLVFSVFYFSWKRLRQLDGISQPEDDDEWLLRISNQSRLTSIPFISGLLTQCGDEINVNETAGGSQRNALAERRNETKQ